MEFDRKSLLKHKWLTAGGLTLTILVVTLFYMDRRVEIEAVTAQKGQITGTLSEHGYVQAGQEYTIRAPVSARIQRLNLKVGDTVKKGEPLLVLESRDLEIQMETVHQEIAKTRALLDVQEVQLQATEASLALAQKEQRKNQQLHEAGALSNSDYELSVHKTDELNKQKVAKTREVAGYRQQLEILDNLKTLNAAKSKQLSVESPVDGKVFSLNVENGRQVFPGEELAKVGSLRELTVRADFLSDDMADLRPGQQAMIEAPLLKGKILEGRIKQIYPVAQETLSSLGVLQRRVPVIIALADSRLLEPGYEVEVTIRTGTAEGIVLPSQAIYLNKNKDYEVKIVENGRVKFCKITPGLQAQDKVEVKEGLQGGELVISSARPDLKEGTRVKPKLRLPE